VSYIAARIPVVSSFGQSGGAGFVTTRVTNAAGFEIADQTDPDGIRTFNVTFKSRSQADFEGLRAHYINMHGRNHDFPWRDYSDYLVTAAVGVLGDGAATGFPGYQLGRAYTVKTIIGGMVTTVYPVKKPCEDIPLIVYRNGIAASEGALAGEWEVDSSRGTVLWTAISSKTISNITNANPGVVTAVGHGFTNGQTVYLSDIGGMVELNGDFGTTGTIATVAGKTTDTFQLDGIDTTDFGAYTSGGTAALYPQPGEPLRWSGGFDTPVHYDSDNMDADLFVDKSGGEFIYNWTIALRESKIL
jgi:uncharacterized protein (TIGR02217 family)